MPSEEIFEEFSPMGEIGNVALGGEELRPDKPRTGVENVRDLKLIIIKINSYFLENYFLRNFKFF